MADIYSKDTALKFVLIFFSLAIVASPTVLAQERVIDRSRISPGPNGDKVHLGEPLDRGRKIFGEDQLPELLDDVEFIDDVGTSTDITQNLVVGDQKVEFGKPSARNDKDPILHIEAPTTPRSDNFLFSLQASFEDGLDFTSEDVVGEQIKLFGKEYYVLDSSPSELALSRPQRVIDLETGESITIDIDGEEHSIKAESVLSVSGSVSASVRIDGKLVEKSEGQNFSVNEVNYRLKDIIKTSADENVGVVRLAIEPEELHISNGERIENRNGAEINGTYAVFNKDDSIENPVSDVQSLDIYIGADNYQDNYIESGEKYSHSLFENIQLDFHYLPSPGQITSGEGNLLIDTKGAETVEVTTKAGGDTTPLEVMHVENPEDGEPILFADEDGDRIMRYEGDSRGVEEDRYFISRGFFEVTSIDRDGTGSNMESDDQADIRIRNQLSEDTFDVELQADTDEGVYEGREVIGGVPHYFEVEGSGNNPSAKIVWGDGAGFDSEDGSVDPGEEMDLFPSFRHVTLLQRHGGISYTGKISLPSMSSNEWIEVSEGEEVIKSSSPGAKVVDSSSYTATVEVKGGMRYKVVWDGELFITPLAHNSDTEEPIESPSLLIQEREDDYGEEHGLIVQPAVSENDGGIQAAGKLANLYYTGGKPGWTYDDIAETLESDDDVEVGHTFSGTSFRRDTDAQGSFEAKINGYHTYVMSDIEHTEEEDTSGILIERNISSYSLTRIYERKVDDMLDLDFASATIHTATYRNKSDSLNAVVYSFDSRKDLNRIYTSIKSVWEAEEKSFEGNNILWRKDSDYVVWSNGNKLVLLSKRRGRTDRNREGGWEGTKEKLRPFLTAYLERHSSDIEDLKESVGGYPEFILEENIGKYDFKFSASLDEVPEEADSGYLGVYASSDQRRGSLRRNNVQVYEFESRSKLLSTIKERWTGRYSGEIREINNQSVFDHKEGVGWVQGNKIINVGGSKEMVEAYLKKHPSDLNEIDLGLDELVSVRVEKGWNLVSNGIFARETAAGSQIERDDIRAVFHYNSKKNKYVRIHPEPDINQGKRKKIARNGPATWVYSDKSGWLRFKTPDVDVKPISKRPLHPGWNFVSIEESIVGRTETGDNIQLKDIKGSCNIQDTYLYDPDTEWKEVSLSTPLSGSLRGEGMIVKVKERCSLEKPQREIQPPELPERSPPAPS